MVSRAPLSLIDHLAALDDPPESGKFLYSLAEILLVVLCGTLAGSGGFVDMRRRAEGNRVFLGRFSAFADGIPSHDTLTDVFTAVDGDLFSQCFSD